MSRAALSGLPSDPLLLLLSLLLLRRVVVLPLSTLIAAAATLGQLTAVDTWTTAALTLAGDAIGDAAADGDDVDASDDVATDATSTGEATTVAPPPPTAPAPAPALGPLALVEAPDAALALEPSVPSTGMLFNAVQVEVERAIGRRSTGFLAGRLTAQIRLRFFPNALLALRSDLEHFVES